MAAIGEMGSSLIRWFAAQPVSRRAVILGLFVGFGIVFATFVQRYKGGDLELLYGRLREEDAGAITERLKAMAIAYEVREGGAIYVPRGAKYDLRATLASEGLPYNGSGVGFEIFDKSQLGTTDYVQKINFQRALRGELSRTINSLAVVRSSRVTFQIPDPSPFLSESVKPSASVVVDLVPGQRLTESQVRGIANIVVSAAPGLTVDSVKVIDGKGELLSTASGESPEMMNVTTQQLRHQRAYEEKVKRDIENMLERWVGRGHVVAQVSAEFDFSQQETTEETYEDDNKAITQENRTTEQRGPLKPPEAAATPASDASGAADASKTEKKAEPKDVTPTSLQDTSTKMYQVGKTQRTIKNPVGKLLRLQAAVLVDGLYEGAPADKGGAAAPDAKAARAFKSRFPDQEEAFNSVVKAAMGFNEDRGDTAKVECVPFDTGFLTSDEQEEAENGWEERAWQWARQVGSVGGPLLVILLFFTMGMRPFLKFLDREQSARLAAQARLKTVAELESALGGATLEGGEDALPELMRRREGDGLQSQINAMAKSDPKKSAQLIRSWLEQ